MKKLGDYNEKRDFNKTKEPRGGVKSVGIGKSGGLRYVVQHHLASRDHYDFRLEWDGELLSWAVPKGPSFNPEDKRLAIRVENHPLEYRNFEGVIPKGQYGGGDVMLWDEGFWKPETDVGKGLESGALKFTVFGRRLKGDWALIKIDGENAKKNGDNWLLVKEDDEYAKKDGGISRYATSVRSGRTMEEIDKGAYHKFTENPFGRADAQLAKTVTAPPESDDWLFEVKYDGYRILAFAENNAARLITRNGKDFTARFAEIADSLVDLADGRAFVLDGEMVVTDENGKTDFQALQSFMKNPSGKNLTYVVFDILALDGADLRRKALTERKDALEKLMKDAAKNLCFSVYVRGNGRKCFQAACESDLEGVMGKKADSVYSGTRNGDWIKIKCGNRQEFVVGGYTKSDKNVGGISSLLLGYYDGGKLIFAGRAGTGFTEKGRKELEEKFSAAKINASAFDVNSPKPGKNEKFAWIRPDFVAEVKFAEWTDEGLLRQASYKGLRTDKNPKDVRMEKAEKNQIAAEKKPKKNALAKELEKAVKSGGKKIEIHGIKITNPDKILFKEKGIRKIDVISYYAKVSERMLPYVGGRILSIVRCPKGVSAPCFFKKHPDTDNKGVAKIPIVTNGGEKDVYFCIENEYGLISEAQMGTLEFHVWGSRAKTMENPDMMVFDLDPDEGMDLTRVRQGVKDLKKLLDRLSLVSFLKTSGGKGYHIVVPFEPCENWEIFHDFARKIAEIMERNYPDRYTSNIRKDSRKGRIFIDWQRNGRGATSVAPYSLRAKKGAGVSMPISWKELDSVAPDGIKMADALSRLSKSDPWKNYFTVKQTLK